MKSEKSNPWNRNLQKNKQVTNKRIAKTAARKPSKKPKTSKLQIKETQKQQPASHHKNQQIQKKKTIPNSRENRKVGNTAVISDVQEAGARVEWSGGPWTPSVSHTSQNTGDRSMSLPSNLCCDLLLSWPGISGHRLQTSSCRKRTGRFAMSKTWFLFSFSTGWLWSEVRVNALVGMLDAFFRVGAGCEWLSNEKDVDPLGGDYLAPISVVG